MDARRKGEAGVAVPQIVKADDGQPGRTCPAPERIGQTHGVDGVAVLLGEDESALHIGRPAPEPLLNLPDPVRPQSVDRGGVQSNGAPRSLGLRLGELDGITDGDQRLLDGGSRPASRSTSVQRSPRSSPRRIPVVAASR